MDYLASCTYSIRLIKKLESLDSENQLDFVLIDKAIVWAKKYHDGQFRKSGEPYYTHPLEVAYMVSEHLLKTDVIVASILHDIVEDTEVTAGMILDNFGRRIEEMVDMLTRDRPDGSKISVEESLLNAYQKHDKEVLLIKAIDRLHNMETIGAKTPQKQEKTSKETLELFFILTASMGWSLISERLYNISKNLNSTITSIKQEPKLGQGFFLPPLPNFGNKKH